LPPFFAVIGRIGSGSQSTALPIANLRRNLPSSIESSVGLPAPTCELADTRAIQFYD
jgi:hypothetical protein